MGNIFGKRKNQYEVVGVDLEDLSAEEEGKGNFKQTKTHTRVLLTLMPYLWPKGEWKVRISVIISLTLMLLAKICTVAIPLCYKNAVDILTQDDSINSANEELNSIQDNQQNNSTMLENNSEIDSLLDDVSKTSFRENRMESQAKQFLLFTAQSILPNFKGEYKNFNVSFRFLQKKSKVAYFQDS